MWSSHEDKGSQTSGIPSWKLTTFDTMPILKFRIAALSRCRLMASRFDWFAAFYGAPSHCLPQGSRLGIVAGQTGTLEGARG